MLVELGGELVECPLISGAQEPHPVGGQPGRVEQVWPLGIRLVEHPSHRGGQCTDRIGVVVVEQRFHVGLAQPCHVAIVWRPRR